MLPFVKHGGYLLFAVPGLKKDIHANLPPEMLLSWTAEDIETLHDTAYWRKMLEITYGSHSVSFSLPRFASSCCLSKRGDQLTVASISCAGCKNMVADFGYDRQSLNPGIFADIGIVKEQRPTCRILPRESLLSCANCFLVRFQVDGPIFYW